MEVPHTPENDELSDKVDKLYLRMDMGYFAIMGAELDRIREENDK